MVLHIKYLNPRVHCVWRWAVVSVIFVALQGGSASAQENRYSTWTNPNQTQSAVGTAAARSDAMAEELRKLVRDAEKAKAADPKFLRDLNALADRYGGPRLVNILSDDFSDGNYTNNPIWKVRAGKYWVEKGYGLRAESGATAGGTAQQQNQQRQISREELAGAVIGSILKNALGDKATVTTNNSATSANTPATTPAMISVAQDFSNAFRIRVEISSWQQDGSFSFGPYQGISPNTGYRLNYQAGKRPALQLVRFSSRGENVIFSDDRSLSLEDKRTHVLEWDRTAAGDMTVKVDGKVRMQVGDIRIRDRFDGFVIHNAGGDFIVSRVDIMAESR